MGGMAGQEETVPGLGLMLNGSLSFLSGSPLPCFFNSTVISAFLVPTNYRAGGLRGPV